MKTMKAIRTQLLLMAMLVVSATAVAQEETQVREVEQFSRLTASSIIKVELLQGDNYMVEVKADNNILEKVEVSVTNGTLHLDYKGSTRNERASVVVIAPTIERINLTGAANLTTPEGLNVPTLDMELTGASSATMALTVGELRTSVSGASNLRLSGEAGIHQAVISGASQLRAEDLTTSTTRIKASGASHARVNAIDNLMSEASGSAKITYTTVPVNIDVNTSGAGSVNGPRADAGTEAGDTTRIRIGGRDVWVIDEEGDVEKVERKERKSFRSNWSGFEMGVNGYMAPDYNINLPAEASPIDLRYERSFVYNLNLFQQNLNLIGNNLGLFTGVGFSWINYRFDNQTRIHEDNQGVYFTEDTIHKMKRNKINITYVNVPIMLEFQTHGARETQKFNIAGGVIVGARIANNARYVYDDNGKTRKEKVIDDFAINPFKFDLSGRIGWGKINFFATYALNTLFKEGKGPELYPFTVGLQLVNF